jgi:ethanolamine ammonia-lyase small subunit
MKNKSSDPAMIGTSVKKPALAETDPRSFTPARISLTSTGKSIATRHALAFALDHAQARDAVHATLSLPTLLHELHWRGLEPVAVKSAVRDRANYLRRPDLGRILSDDSQSALNASARNDNAEARPRLTIILADGLSALATDRHAIPLLDALLPLVREAWHLTPVVIAEQARVALGDEIGVALRAQMTVMLIGERPGLSAADSLGAYITWNPRSGCTNAERNCISNIRDEGLSSLDAAQRIAWFLREANRLQTTGTALKDPDSDLRLA